MHSIRMRTARSLTVSHSIQLGDLPNPQMQNPPPTLDAEPRGQTPPTCVRKE